MSDVNLKHMQRLSVIFEYFTSHIDTDNKMDRFSLHAKIDRRVVLSALRREEKRLSILNRYNICVNLHLRASIWSDAFENEQHMFKNIYKYLSDTI